MKNKKLDAIMDALQLKYFPRNGVPMKIIFDNEGQFVTNRWRDFAANMFSIRKTPYNLQNKSCRADNARVRTHNKSIRA